MTTISHVTIQSTHTSKNATSLTTSTPKKLVAIGLISTLAALYLYRAHAQTSPSTAIALNPSIQFAQNVTAYACGTLALFPLTTFIVGNVSHRLKKI